MIVFCSDKQQIASLIEFLIFVVICVAIMLIVGVIDPIRISKGHFIKYMRELPFLYKLLYGVIIGVPLLISVLCSINMINEAKYIYQANHNLLEVNYFSVESDILVSDAEYRGEKIGNNISLKINGDFVLTVAVIPDDVIDTILRSEKVEISFGYVGKDLEIWSIRVEDTS